MSQHQPGIGSPRLDAEIQRTHFKFFSDLTLLVTRREQNNRGGYKPREEELAHLLNLWLAQKANTCRTASHS
jgi:hypothetical protein